MVLDQNRRRYHRGRMACMGHRGVAAMKLSRRIQMLRYRIQNTRYWLRKGFSLRRAWRKVDLTL